MKSIGREFAPGMDMDMDMDRGVTAQRGVLSCVPRAACVLAAGCLCVAVAVALSACATHVSEGLRDDGEVRRVVFPPVEQATWRDGIFPDRTVLRAIEPGVRKAQLLHWFGPPHFSEGIGGVREWDYIFHFYSGGGITTCRYKVLFDTRYVARRFHWQPDECGQWLSPALMPSATTAAPP